MLLVVSVNITSIIDKCMGVTTWLSKVNGWKVKVIKAPRQGGILEIRVANEGRTYATFPQIFFNLDT